MAKLDFNRTTGDGCLLVDENYLGEINIIKKICIANSLFFVHRFAVISTLHMRVCVNTARAAGRGMRVLVTCYAVHQQPFEHHDRRTCVGRCRRERVS